MGLTSLNRRNRAPQNHINKNDENIGNCAFSSSCSSLEEIHRWLCWNIGWMWWLCCRCSTCFSSCHIPPQWSHNYHLGSRSSWYWRSWSCRHFDWLWWICRFGILWTFMLCYRMCQDLCHLQEEVRGENMLRIQRETLVSSGAII